MSEHTVRANDHSAGSPPGPPELTWEQRLRALDDALANVGARVEEDMAVGSTIEPDGNQGRLASGAARDVDDLDDADSVADVADQPASAEETEQQAAARRRRALLDWVVVIGVALLVAFLVRTFVLAHFVVDGVSMSSTLHDDDRVFVNKLSYRLHDPNRGDVVVLHQLNGTSERDLIKRVIALPGEEIRVEECVVYIDGAILREPYLDPAATTPGTCGRNVEAQTIPEDHVFVMGDNRGGSMDSRDLGAISESDLVGRAFVVFWPSSNWQWL